MKFMTLTRVLAQIIDLIVGIGCLVVSFLVVLPVLSRFMPDYAAAALTLIVAVLLIVLLQAPFFHVNQTLGKGFFGLEVRSTDPKQDLTGSILFQREIFLKLFTCYIICIPVLLGKTGGHETATSTEVVRKTKRK